MGLETTLRYDYDDDDDDDVLLFIRITHPSVYQLENACLKYQKDDANDGDV